MSKIAFKNENMTKIFSPERGNSKYTKKYCQDKKGEYPLYSANNNTPHEYVNFYDYDGKYLTVSVNGIAGILTIKNERFSCTADRMVFIPISQGICLEYIKYVLEPLLRKKIKGRIGINYKNEFTKLPESIIKTISIPIPINEDGTFDLNTQMEIANKYALLERRKQELICRKSMIENISIDFFTNKSIDNVKISKICDVISENHKYTKQYINAHKGEYPVYSATIDEPFGYTDNYDFDEELLIIVNYGNSGKTYLVNGKYCVGRNVCGLRVKDEYKDSISLDFIKEIQTPIFISMAKGQKQKNLNQGMVKNATISIPIKKDGTYDLDAQTEIANKYKVIEEIKKKLINELDEIINKNIIIN